MTFRCCIAAVFLFVVQVNQSLRQVEFIVARFVLLHHTVEGSVPVEMNGIIRIVIEHLAVGEPHCGVGIGILRLVRLVFHHAGQVETLPL